MSWPSVRKFEADLSMPTDSGPATSPPTLPPEVLGTPGTDLPALTTRVARTVEVVPTGNRDANAQVVSATESDDVLALFPDEPGAPVVPYAVPVHAEAPQELHENGPETEIVLKQLVSRTGALRRRLDELQEFADKLSSEYRKIEETSSETAATLTGKCLHVEEVSREAAARFNDEYRRVDVVSREAEQRSATAVETLKQIEKSLAELTLLHDLARTEERLAALDQLSGELAEKLRQKAKNRTEAIETVLQQLHAAIGVAAIGLVRFGRFTRQWLVVLWGHTSIALAALGRHAKHWSTAFFRVATIALAGFSKEVGHWLAILERGASRFMSRFWSHPIFQVNPATQADQGRVAPQSSQPHSESVPGGSALPRVTRHVQVSKVAHLIPFRGAVLAGLGLLALLGFLVSRSSGKTDQEDTQLAASHAASALTALRLDLPLTLLPRAKPTAIMSVEQPTKAVPTMVGTAGTARSVNLRAQPPKQPVQPAKQPAAARQLVPAKPPAQAAQPKQLVQAGRFVGTLEITSDPPGAAVLVDRKRVGQTPIEVSQLQSGSHVIWIERSGYLRWTAAVHVSADKLTRVSARLEPDSSP
jgi:PEGA domain